MLKLVNQTILDFHNASSHYCERPVLPLACVCATSPLTEAVRGSVAGSLQDRGKKSSCCQRTGKAIPSTGSYCWHREGLPGAARGQLHPGERLPYIVHMDTPIVKLFFLYNFFIGARRYGLLNINKFKFVQLSSQLMYVF